MKSRFVSIILLVCCVSLCTIGCKKKQSPNNNNDCWVHTKPISPEAEPVRNWLQSIKAKDLALFKTVFSKQMQGIMEAQGWGPSLGTYTLLFSDQFGDFDIDDLSYNFIPDETTKTTTEIVTDPVSGQSECTTNPEINTTSGQIEVIQNGLSFPPIDIILEDGAWKVDER